jgi:hypothetical protein
MTSCVRLPSSLREDKPASEVEAEKHAELAKTEVPPDLWVGVHLDTVVDAPFGTSTNNNAQYHGRPKAPDLILGKAPPMSACRRFEASLKRLKCADAVEKVSD